jgi:hypothetical protein
MGKKQAPGPWEVFENQWTEKSVLVQEVGGYEVAEVEFGPYRAAENEEEARTLALIIASAPAFTQLLIKSHDALGLEYTDLRDLIEEQLIAAGVEGFGDA